MVPPAPIRVGRRAVILYTLVMRGTVEGHLNHPRAKDWVEILPHWLDRLEVGSEADPRDLEILTTPLGELDPAIRAEVQWYGEASAVLGWALQRVVAPADFDPVDPNEVFTALGFEPATMVQGAGDLIAGASLRPMDELLAYYSKLSIVQCCLRCRGLNDEDVKSMLQQIVRKQLDERGVLAVDFAAAQESVMRLPDEQYRHLRGVYPVRVHAAGWLVGERDRYWEEAKETADEK